MKKVLVLSDSHGNIENMRVAVDKTMPDLIIHLGDCYADALALRTMYPDIPMEQVPGNCDCRDEALERILIIEEMPIMICHGHTRNVKSNYLALEYAAIEKDVMAALFGHTHRVYYQQHNGLLLLNPGSVGAPGITTPPSYAVLTIDGENRNIIHKIEYI